MQHVQLDIKEENQLHLYIAFKACKGNFKVLTFDFFLELLRELFFLYFYRKDYPNFGTYIGNDKVDKMC